MKKVLLGIVVVIVGISGCALMDPFSTQFEPQENALTLQAKTVKPAVLKDNLKVMTYNIKFGAGREDMFFDCYGKVENIPKTTILQDMKALVSYINRVNPDILFVQELDINSTRTGDVDQLSYILNHSDLNYAVFASQWKASWVPTHNLGHINSGTAIFSKVPLGKSKRIALKLFDSQDPITRYFYLKRNLLVSSIMFEGKKINLIATHLSAYAKDDTKAKQLKTFLATAKGFKDSPLIFGGDLNSLAPSTKKFNNFNDDACKEGDFSDTGHTNYKTELQPFYDAFTPAISLKRYDANNSEFFSFTSDKKGFFNRKLDYLFTNQNFSNGKILQDTMQLSDHAPLVVNFSLK